MQPYPFTPYLQASVAVAALLIGASAMFATYLVWRGERNARLVEIGINVLRADPKKEPSAAAARTWALDLIDANAGGVKFSAEARRQLMEEALTSYDGSLGGSWGLDYGKAPGPSPSRTPGKISN
jgi:hypothetical protein